MKYRRRAPPRSVAPAATPSRAIRRSQSPSLPVLALRVSLALRTLFPFCFPAVAPSRFLLFLPVQASPFPLVLSFLLLLPALSLSFLPLPLPLFSSPPSPRPEPPPPHRR